MSLKYLKFLEIEIQSKCNRKCSWCPNVEVDIFSHSTEMSEEAYMNILEGIRSVDLFDETKLRISYSRYNEPFYKPDLLKKRVKQAKDMFPLAELCCNTNGDYLRKRGSKDLDDLMLDTLNIMDYDNRGVEHGKELFKKCGIKLNNSPRRMKQFDETKPITKSNRSLLGYRNNITLINYHIDWTRTSVGLEDRGGYFTNSDGTYKEVINNYGKNKGEKIKFRNYERGKGLTGKIPTPNKMIRRRKCLYPTYGIWVDYDGGVFGCCQMRGDLDIHKDYILGNVYNTPIKDIFNSKKAKEFRKLLRSDKWDEYPTPCKRCGIFTEQPELDELYNKGHY